MELFELGIKAAREGIAKGEFSSVELTQAVIDRCHAKNAEIGAYLTFDEEQALELARANPKAVPIAVKDLINVAGQPCTCASKILKGYVSPYDATVIKNMKSHGFIPAGRVNMDEFAMGSSTENSGLGVTRNPYDLSRVPGGSSGGSAAAVGGNLCIAALGTDTGGSIRQPASFCNCVGVKPSYGRVSRYGVTAFASSLDQVGPMTKSVEDAAILLGALAGHDEMDGTTPRDPVPDYAAAIEGASMKGVRIGVAKEYFDVKGMDPEVKRITEEALAKCEQSGAELVEVSLPHTEYAMAVYYIIAPAEASANLARFDGVRYGHRSAESKDVFSLYTKSRAEGFGPEVKRRIIMGTYVLSSGYYDAYYGSAQKVRTLIQQDYAAAFAQVDVIATPSAPTTAFKIGENSMSVTTSIGLGTDGLTYAQNFEYARNAIDLALGRGGDQAVIKTKDQVTYYGGKSQTVEKSTRVKARVKAQALREIITAKENVLIMGHRNPDADAFGAAVGIYCISKVLGKNAYIVMDNPNSDIQPIVDTFVNGSEEFEDVLITSQQAIDFASTGSVLVVVDVNKPSITECPDLIKYCKTIVVLDHHRAGNEVIENATLSYIEPYASSACEMISEILQYAADNVKIRPEEADCMYSGIMVDSNNFQSKAGVRTFEAAAFLRRCGADVTRVRKMFRADASEYKAKADAVSQAEIYRGSYAISICTADDCPSPTVIGAQAANELLNIRGIKASFVLTEFGSKIHISARSIDEVNVQLIMERMGGGGHLSVAACQLEGTQIEEAIGELKNTIDSMMESGEI